MLFKKLGLVLIVVAITSPLALAQMMGPPAPRNQPQSGTAGPAQVQALKNKVWGFFKGEPVKPPSTLTGRPNVFRATPTTSTTPAPAAPPAAPARPPLLAEPEPTALNVETPKISKENPPHKHPALDNPTNPLGLADPINKLANINLLLDKKEFLVAKGSLVPLRQWLIDATEAHINLYKTLDNVSTAQSQAELEKQLAFQFAVMRDKAMFAMARVWVHEHDYRNAIKDLVEVIKSEPRSDLGFRAYGLLQEIGFTEKLQIAE
jgi:hypothetical protein